MTWTKLKLAGGISAIALLALGTITVATSQTRTDGKWTAQEILQKSQEAYAALTSYSSSGEIVTVGGPSVVTTTFDVRLQRPNLYRVDWSQAQSTHTLNGSIWSDGGDNFYVAKGIANAGAKSKRRDLFNDSSEIRITPAGSIGGGGIGSGGAERGISLSANGEPQKTKDMQTTFSAVGVSSKAATLIPSTFFKLMWSPLSALANPRAKVKNESSEKIGEVDCFVISCMFDPVNMGNGKGNTPKTSSRLWIGKQDFLIHQSESTTEGGLGKPVFSDALVIKMLEQQKRTATPEAIKAFRTQIETAKNHQATKIVSTQTHKKITVNPPFSKADFGR